MIDFATAMALARGLHLAAMLSLLGTVGFIAWTLPAATAVPDPLRRRLIRLWWASAVAALLAGAVWFTLQTAAIAGADNLSDLLNAMPIVAEHTRYGNVLLLRLALLAVATLVPLVFPRAARVPLYLTVVLVIIAVALQGLIGHAGATAGVTGDGLVLSESLHLAAAGIWLGALAPLCLSLRAMAPSSAALVCERFSPIGLACVLLLGATGLAQGLELIGSIPALFGTRYGQFAVLKISLFLLALLLAALNRLRLTDRVAAGMANARRHLIASVCVETCVGLAIVGAAAFMASSPPAAHTTPVWPFSWQFSLAPVNEDPDFRQEVVISLVAIGLAIMLAILALVWRRFRVAALVLLVLAVVLRGPSLRLLTVEAYPTSFQTSPTAFSAASIAHGSALYAANCTACHGAGGEGNGPAAAALRIKPADLTMPHLWQHSDGEMFWWLTHGIEDPRGGMAMPGFAASLSDDDRWALIDYVRAHNAGLAMRRDASFDVPVRAPGLPISCSGVDASRMTDLRGDAVHVVTDAESIDEIPAQSGTTTVTLNLRDGSPPAAGSCVAADPAAWQAYAVLADVAPDKLAGSEFLVDPNGWLRAVHRSGSSGGWYSQGDLIAAVRGICANPIKTAGGDEHEHHH